MRMFLNKFLRKDAFLGFVPLGTTQPYVFIGWILFINEKECINSSVQNAFFGQYFTAIIRQLLY